MSSEICLQITSLSSTGEGVGSLKGMKVFVDGALPQETVSAHLFQQKKTYGKAKLLCVHSPAKERVNPPCPLFGQCGGCQIMHLHYPAQLELKKQKVADALQRIGGLYNLEIFPCLPSPPLSYRNKIQVPISWQNGKKTIGFYKKQSHEIIPLFSSSGTFGSKCFIQCQEGEKILSLIAQTLTNSSVRYLLIRNAIFNAEALVIFVTTGKASKELKQYANELIKSCPLIKGIVENFSHRDSENAILGTKFRLLAGRPYIYENILNKKFKISPSAFFQVNPWQAEKLYAKAIEMANISSHEIILDAYCGVGALAILAAQKAKKVYGIECVPQAIKDANENACLNLLSNCTFIKGNAEEKIHQLEPADCVFLNPPRKGCAPELIDTLCETKPAKIIYISCDPATLARDLAKLTAFYRITAVQPFDMFPQTMHVETVVCLKLL